MQPAGDPYRVLGVRRDATPGEVKTAHRRLAKAHHPDAGGDPARFLAIQAAYQVLADPVERSRWDAAHSPGPVAAHDPWTASGVPGHRRGRAARPAGERQNTAPGDGPGTVPRGPTGAAPGGPPEDAGRNPAGSAGGPTMDAFVRSSGAAWSAASRAYFRRVAAEIPHGARIDHGPQTGRGATGGAAVDGTAGGVGRLVRRVARAIRG